MSQTKLRYFSGISSIALILAQHQIPARENSPRLVALRNLLTICASASHFGPVRVLKNPFALLINSRFKMDDEPIPASNSPIASADQLSLAFVSLALYSQFVYCPSLGSRTVLHVKNVLLFFCLVARLFVLCLANCCLCSVLPSAPTKVFVFSLRLPQFGARFCCY